MRHEWTILRCFPGPGPCAFSLRRQPKGTELIEYDCIEGERDEIHFPGSQKKP